MNDTPDQTIKADRVKFSSPWVGLMIILTSAVAGLISVIVIGGVIYLALSGHPIPDELSNWGGIILGFYFGTFVGLIKDYIGSNA